MDPNSLIARVGGAWAGADLQRDFQEEVKGLLKRHNRSFPGAQPVSFSAKHISELKKQDYYVCEKTDGMRYLMYLTHDGEGNGCHYLIDRKNDYYYVRGLHFPHHENNPDFDKFHVGTILDGELVEDRFPDGRSEIKYLVFDCLVCDEKAILDRPLDKRLGYLNNFIIQPYKKMLKKYPERRGPFLVEDKQVEFSYALPKMFHEIIPKVKQLHGNDGLIFTCKGTKYQSGTDQHILKWKPPSENTIDFLVNIRWQMMEPEPSDPDQSLMEDYLALPAEFELFVYYGGDGEYNKHGTMHVTSEEWEYMKSLNKPVQHSIVECYLETSPSTNGLHVNGNGHTERKWRFHRFRDDKTDANHISTYNSVIDSIEDHITQEDLLQQADEIRTSWKARDSSKLKRGPPA